jgi:hypothetical protein
MYFYKLTYLSLKGRDGSINDKAGIGNLSIFHLLALHLRTCSTVCRRSDGPSPPVEPYSPFVALRADVRTLSLGKRFK